MEPGTELRGEAGAYRITEKLGAGGMGVVFRAVEIATGAPVAVKALTAEGGGLAARMRREIKTLRTLAHPRLVRYRDAGLAGGKPFVVTDLIEGLSLAEEMGQLDPGALRDRAVRWTRDIADGLAAVHAVGVVHRDLKPANVMIDASDRAIVIDFGVARLEGATTLTAEGEVLGTLCYVSPEVFEGQRATPATDVYGWGLIAYELLAGARPWAEHDPVHAAHMRQVGVRPLRVPAELAPLAELVDRCLLPAPANRPADGRALLEWFQAREPAAVPAVAPPRAPPEPRSEVPPRIGVWDVVRPIGKGGMGTVFEGRSASSGERVAIKLIAPALVASPAARERFAREARMLAALADPRVVRVLDFGEHEGRPYLVMQYLEGETLAAYVRTHAPLPLAAALGVLLPIAEGVAALHARGIVHRDLKPSNVMMTATGPRLVDFGLARDAADGHLTVPGEFLGTPEYAAPEALRGQTVRPAGDVYSIGLMLVELLTGERAGRRPDVADALREALGRDRLLDGAAGLIVREVAVAAVARAVHVDPLARPPDGAALARLLRQVAQDAGRLASPAALPARAPGAVAPPPARTSALTWLVLTVVCAGAAGLLWLAGQMLGRAGP